MDKENFQCFTCSENHENPLAVCSICSEPVCADCVKTHIMAHVTDRLVAMGMPAACEYPGFILVGNWSFGTANDTWGGDNSFIGANDTVDFEIPSNSTDVERIATAIYDFMLNIL